MGDIILNIGIIFGIFAIVFGAFGAHLLKKYMSTELLVSFESGVKYQMYHAILLVALSRLLNFDCGYALYAVIFIILGIILFSFSIYGLCLSSTFGNKIKILGPITPLGGLCFIIGWTLLFFATFN